MATEKRRTGRKARRYPLSIERGDGLPRIPCILFDIAGNGARLAVEGPYNVPEEFTLLLSSDGSARRRCRVVWRSRQEIGIEFLDA